MNYCKAGIYLFLLLLPLQGKASSHLLQKKEIHTIMSEMLKQHIDHPNLTPKSYADAIRYYLDSADESHIYLLQQEIAPWLHEDRASLLQAVQSFTRGDDTLFSELNNVIEKAILRSRILRKFPPHLTAALFQKAAKDLQSDSFYKRGYAKDRAALTKRLQDHFVEFISQQMARFGIENVLASQESITKKYTHSLELSENEYLTGRDSPFSKQEQESFFATHVLKAIAKSLDAHSSFFSENEAEEMRMRLEKGFLGIGTIVSEVIDGFVISDMLTDSPAMRSGKIQLGDRLEKIDGHSLLGLSMGEVKQLLKAAKTSQSVNLTISRGGNRPQIVEVKLRPEMLVVDTGRVDTSFEKYRGGIIGQITLHSFYEGPKGVNSASDIENAIIKLRNEGDLKGLILDLRDNGGGYLTQAVKVAGLFISSGVVVMSKYSDGEKTFYRDLDGKRAYDGPLVILTSKLTASAAEIVAQTLQDYGVAVVVGDKQTYGKGTIQTQTVTEGDRDSYFKVTIGKYYTVSGATTQVRGVRADIVLPGEYSQMPIGESYLDSSIVNDTIASAFTDTLIDIEPKARPWYLKHYLPVLQNRQTRWKKLLPDVQKRSKLRTQSDPHYQQFLQALNNPQLSVEGFDIAKYQMREATSIVEDMIDANAAVNKVVEGRIGAKKNLFHQI